MLNVRVPLGSISSGTTRPEDLIPCFIDVLDDIRVQLMSAPEEGTERGTEVINQIEARFACLEENQSKEGYWESEDARHDLEDLFDELDNYAPPYCRFGAHEGDGADYGYWVCWDALEEAARDGDVLKIDSSDEWPDLPEDVEYVLEVNDHGNATLYDRHHNEVWGVV